MGCEPILPDIQPITIDTMLNRILADIKNEKIGLNFVTCEQSLHEFKKFPLVMKNNMTKVINECLCLQHPHKSDTISKIAWSL